MAITLHDYCIERNKTELLSQWDSEKNAGLTPRDVNYATHRKAWWICDKGHEYEAYISIRTRDRAECPYCKGKKVLAGFNDLATKEPELAKQWHPELNGDLTPQMVSAGSARRVWWQCAEGHVWNAVVYSRTSRRRTGCPVCAGVVSEEKQIRYDEMMGLGRK